MLLCEESSCLLETLKPKAELLDRACQSLYSHTHTVHAHADTDTVSVTLPLDTTTTQSVMEIQTFIFN